MKRALYHRNRDREISSSNNHNLQRRVLVFVLLLTGGFLCLQLVVDGPPDYISMENDENKTNSAIPSRRKNITAALLSISTNPTLGNLFDILPEPQERDTLQVYNITTHQELVKSLHSKANLTICVSGGSSSAGAGGVRLEDRYFSKYYNYQKVILNSHTDDSKLVDRSHGNRDSLHSAIFADNFFPQEADLLLWEFAINDGEHLDSNDPGQVEQSLVAWLQQVQRMGPDPPKVILIYLWPAFRLDDSKAVTNPVFAGHDRIAAKFEFVVGHVNLISYIHELRFPEWEDTQLLYSTDWMHVNEKGHLIVAFLLLDLVHGTKHLEQNTTAANSSRVNQDPSQMPIYSWQCGNETADKRLVESRISEVRNGTSRFRSPLASWTLEVPQNAQSKLDVLTPFDLHILGKQDPSRHDRQGSVMLPCCSPGNLSSVVIIGLTDTSNPLQNARTIFFGFGRIRPFDKLQIYVDTKAPKTADVGKLIPMDDRNDRWPCVWNFHFYHAYWFLLEHGQEELSTISLCVESNQCMESQSSDMMLVSLAIY